MTRKEAIITGMADLSALAMARARCTRYSLLTHISGSDL
jgi:hypothetical protein